MTVQAYNNTSAATVRDYITLLKPSVMSLVIFTGAVTFALVPERPPLMLCLVILLALSLGSGAAGAFNMWADRDIDAVMRRTRSRPIPRGVIAPEEAISFSVFLMGLAVFLMGLASNWLAAGALLAAQLIYTHIYTLWLKRRSAQNIVIGGLSGALPPLIVWLACGGDILNPLPWSLVLVIFLWTPPHFWALALIRQEDYSRAQLPMYPQIHGEPATRRAILLYSGLLALSGVLPFWLTEALSSWYLIGASGLGLLFFCSALRMCKTARPYHARQLFGFSIVYLFLLFGLIPLSLMV